MTQQNQPNGLSLWQEVQTTDPAFTRSFERSSGFQGTAINPTYLVRKVTEVFGPIGLDWGVEPLEESFREGHVIGFPADGGPPIRCVIHVLKVEVWYVKDGKRASVKQFGQTTFIGKTKDGTIYTNEEAPKMSMTDGMTKCLSLLGFGGDVHLGLYDDVKYVADLDAAFSQGVLPKARNTSTSNDRQHPNETSAGNGSKSQQGANGSPRSARYEQFKTRLTTLKPDEKTTARAAIKADEGLSDLERQMLLSMPQLKDETVQANDVTETADTADTADAARNRRSPGKEEDFL